MKTDPDLLKQLYYIRVSLTCFFFCWFHFRETEKKTPQNRPVFLFFFFLIFETRKKSLPFHSDLKHRLKHFDDNLSETDQPFRS